MPNTIPASTACEQPAVSTRLRSTCEQLIAEQIPNLFRLYLNPHVIRACYYLAELVAERWPRTRATGRYRVFLANSGDEALSGALKLARYHQAQLGRDGIGLLISDGDVADLASVQLGDRGRLEFLPDLVTAADLASGIDQARASGRVVDFAAIPDGQEGEWIAACAALSGTGTKLKSSRRTLPAQDRLLILSTERHRLACVTDGDEICPDIVVFDNSFTHGEVPFGAFAARSELLDDWQRGKQKTFHSTTFQPNSIASLHFVRCLTEDQPELVRRLEPKLAGLDHDAEFSFELFEQLYSRPLARLMRTLGCATSDIRAAGHYVTVRGRQVFDTVAGVACSLRGHNPSAYIRQLSDMGTGEECRRAATERLANLSGLPHVLPAVSGASAVESALKLALVSQFPRDYVLAFQGGFGGKTLLALTGTWKDTLRSHAGPLYPKVVFIDPFAPGAVDALSQAFREYPIGVVQMELIQGVGGVRAMPLSVVEAAQALCRAHDTLLFVDEVQTGMFRTGPFARCVELGLAPDLMTIGKATSDMMLPSSFVLYGERVGQRVVENDCKMIGRLERRHACSAAWATLDNALRWAEDTRLEQAVRARSQQFAERLREQLRDSPVVRDVRCFGLLIGIELRVGGRRSTRLERLMAQLQSLGMYRHRSFPVLVGFCQYESNVLKITPPLTTTESEVEDMCSTISDVLNHPWWHGMQGALATLAGSLNRFWSGRVGR